MRKSINGKTYDTRSAKLIAEYKTKIDVDTTLNGERNLIRKLYRKKTGKFFIFEVIVYDSGLEFCHKFYTNNDLVTTLANLYFNYTTDNEV